MTMHYLYTIPCSLLLLAACGLGSGDRTTDPSVHGTSTTGSGFSEETGATAPSSDATSDETSATNGSLGHDASTSGGQDTSPTEETSSGETSNNETGPSPAICGNEIVEGDETCDDGNQTPGDGCQECAKDSIVFVSSEVYQGFALEGLYGADQRCRSLAGKASLERHLTYKAWLSTPTMSATDRLLHSPGRYLLVNGLVVAQNWEGLVSGSLENPIMVDEGSLSRDDGVWTGTLSSGEPSLGDEFCEDWDDDSGLLKFAGVGISTKTDATWSFFEPVPCDAELQLYCIEQ